jgi:hypothetical protein
VAGKVNSVNTLYLVVESIKLDTKHWWSSIALPPDDGAGGILYNTTIATAIADRLVENSEVFLLGGDSLRKANQNPPPPAE